MTVARLEALYGRLLDAFMAVAALVLFAMMATICLDVFLRNAGIAALGNGVPAASDASETSLFLITMLGAPWLLRRGQHIRVDIVLRAIPPRAAWCCEWLVDALALACCLAIAWYGLQATLDSFAAGSMVIKTFSTPEWWSLAPLPITFVLLAIEMLFRMWRLSRAPIGPRDDAVSAS